ncbi:transcription initiation factor IIB [Natronobacterium gregoryi]|uniref:Transcription factor TFIIB cyclin-like protein n=2 Tax=Natronobacterium gregoryi TaxID=44930 RepID=L0AG80_NATGS|nr:transcription initiation factor IIB family protein [Natronobacterium gregoryi]AFZ72933.1 transcription initiation factor TFIIIB, Brf1 subunit/transcription initiation factor TFIIB [Natronobacterium gregoryi SP2]ELY69919.1 transcription factor TFIIB cyclin-like protein [Natronobacterium gregoryi SP2]PLK21841.1 transcription initiation factor IIB family protein [Natronobacterium gregoryi SP2]SFI67787.1 Transcription initiation factor IIB (TFIIB) [Natronobacterium gregoryi]
MAGTDRNSHCPECNGTLRKVDTETLCEECGLVFSEDAMDRGPEWRSFEDEETDRRRTGAPLTRSRHDRGLSTEIGYGSGSNSSYESRLTGRKRRQIARLRREHNRARIASKAERNQVYGFAEIRRVNAHLSLPDSTREQACALFESAQSADLFQGRSLEGFAAAAVYATCRTRSIARTVDEIAAVARADSDELTVAYKALNRELGLPTGPIDPTEYLPRYASKLDLGTEVERRAHEHVTTLLQEGRIGGRNPSGVAAACLYQAAGERQEWPTITQATAGEVADVAPVTIRSTVKDIRDLRK